LWTRNCVTKFTNPTRLQRKFNYASYRVTISVGFSCLLVPGKYQAITEFRVSSSVHQTMLVTVVPSRYINTEKAKIKLSLDLMSKILRRNTEEWR